MEILVQILAYASMISVLIPMLFHFIYKPESKTTNILFGLLCASLLADIANEVYIKTGYRGAIIDNIYFLAQYVFVSLIFIKICSHLKKVVYISSLIYLFLVIANTIFLQHIQTLQSYTNAVQNIIFIVYTFIYFSQLNKELIVEDLVRYHPFWIVTSIFFYSLLSLYIFALAHYVFIYLPKEYGMVLWTFYMISNIIKNILFSVAIFYAGKNKKQEMNDIKEPNLITA